MERDKLKFSISKNSIVIFLLVFPFIELEGPTSINWLHKIFLILRFASILYGLCLFLKKPRFELDRKKIISNEMIYIITYFCLLIVSAAINNNVTVSKIWFSVGTIYICIIVKHFIKIDSKSAICGLHSMFFLICLLNVATVVFKVTFSSNPPVYLLGIRTSFTMYSMFLLLMSGIHSYLVKGKVFSKISIPSTFIAWMQIVLVWSGTGLFVLAVTLIVYIILKVKIIRKIHFCLIGAISGIVVNYLVVFMNIQVYFTYLLENLLKKNTTLTDRIYIWESAIIKMQDSYIWGYGNMFETVSWAKKEMFAHNQWMQLMLATGIVGTVYFAAILIVCGYKMDQFENSNMKNFVLGVFFSVMLLFISEVVFYRNFFWLLFVVMANLDYISRGGINNYDKR